MHGRAEASQGKVKKSLSLNQLYLKSRDFRSQKSQHSAAQRPRRYCQAGALLPDVFPYSRVIVHSLGLLPIKHLWVTGAGGREHSRGCSSESFKLK